MYHHLVHFRRIFQKKAKNWSILLDACHDLASKFSRYFEHFPQENLGGTLFREKNCLKEEIEQNDLKKNLVGFLQQAKGEIKKSENIFRFYQ